METPKLITIILLCVSALSWFVWDIYVAVNNKPGDTISEIILYASRYSLLLPAAGGLIIGHLLFPHAFWRIPNYITFSFFGLLAVMYLGFDLHYIFNRETITTGALVWVRKYPIVVFLAHVVVGFLAWNQKPLP